MRDRSELRDACIVAELNVARAKAEVRVMALESENQFLRFQMARSSCRECRRRLGMPATWAPCTEHQGQASG